jgi:hypothetical protein
MTLVFAPGCNFSMAAMIFHAIFLGCSEFSHKLGMHPTAATSTAAGDA